MTKSYIVEYSPHALRSLYSDTIGSINLRPAIEDFSNQLAKPRLWYVLVTFDQLESDQSGSGGLVVSVTFMPESSTCSFDSILESFEAFLYGRLNITVNRFHREIREPAHA